MTKSPQTRLFQVYWEDGTLDLVGGAAVVLIGLTYVLEQLVWVGAIVPLGLVTWWGIRRQVVEPWAGYVEFSRSRRDRWERELTGMIGVGVGVLAMVAFGAVRLAGGVPASLVAGLPAVLLAVGAGLTGGLTRSWRFGAYAAVFVAAAVATVVVGTDPGWPIVAAGLVIWAVGAVLFGRFLAASRRFEEAA
jgi:hypothetical protein